MAGQYITVTSGQENPSDFVSNFTDAINVDDGYEVAVASIAHGPLFNIAGDYRKFIIGVENRDRTKEVLCYIPAGFYESTCSLANAMIASITDKYSEGKLPATVTVQNTSENPEFSGSIKLPSGGKHGTGPKLTFVVKRDKSYGKLLNLFGYCLDNFRFSILKFNDTRLDNTKEMGFLYSNIVPNSLINQQGAHLLALLPIKSKAGYNYYEVSNRIYHPLSVHSFTDVTFTLANVNGKILDLQHTVDEDIAYPTILQLHIKPINRV